MLTRFHSYLGGLFSSSTVCVIHDGGGARCFCILRVTMCIIRWRGGSVEFVSVVRLSKSAYFSWIRVFLGVASTGKPSQQLPRASIKYAALMVWSPGITEHGAGVRGWLAVAYVTIWVSPKQACACPCVRIGVGCGIGPVGPRGVIGSWRYIACMQCML